MFSIETILVLIVFSPHCAWAARYAVRLGREFGSRLIFLHVGWESDYATLENFLATELGPIKHRSIVVDGEPADRIVQFAQEYQADLIVMPTYHARFRMFLIGSVTAVVLHDVKCPVLTGVHHYDDDAQIIDKIPQTFQSVVCALDETPDCVGLARWAVELTSSLHARLHFVHAIPVADEVSENCGEIEIRRYLFEQARRGFAAHFAAEESQPAIDLRCGKIYTVVREAALTEHADLVIVGRGHAPRALGGLRTHTYGIIRNSPCPVISV